MLYLTTEEHRQVLKRLVKLMGGRDTFPVHHAGVEYTSLMMCFALHSKGAAESLMTLHQRFGDDWFPSTTGYVLVRSLFEVDVTAHYISRSPVDRSRRYIEFGAVVDKKRIDAVERHRASPIPSWRELTELMSKENAREKADIETKYASVRTKFEGKHGKPATNWSGKSLKAMAEEVQHGEAYDIFYADLSSFTHVNVKLADRFLRLEEDGPTWTQQALEQDVAFVFRYAVIFLTCFLELFGKEFGLWDAERVHDCWNVAAGRAEPPEPNPA